MSYDLVPSGTESNPLVPSEGLLHYKFTTVLLLSPSNPRFSSQGPSSLPEFRPSWHPEDPRLPTTHPNLGSGTSSLTAPYLDVPVRP